MTSTDLPALHLANHICVFYGITHPTEEDWCQHAPGAKEGTQSPS